jgi:uncharacterized protein YwqG
MKLKDCPIISKTEGCPFLAKKCPFPVKASGVSGCPYFKKTSGGCPVLGKNSACPILAKMKECPPLMKLKGCPIMGKSNGCPFLAKKCPYPTKAASGCAYKGASACPVLAKKSGCPYSKVKFFLPPHLCSIPSHESSEFGILHKAVLIRT